jgi:hypothetical protein
MGHRLQRTHVKKRAALLHWLMLLKQPEKNAARLLFIEALNN